MEKFRKVNAENGTSVELNGHVYKLEALEGRSLVLVNEEKHTVYNVVAKCRDNGVEALVKSLAKAVLAVERVRYEQNHTELVENAAKADVNVRKEPFRMSQALASHTVYLTDKNGEILPGSELSVRGHKRMDGKPETLRTLFRFSAKDNIYKLVVEQGKPWDDVNVVAALKTWCTFNYQRALELLATPEKYDKALSEAAESTEKENKAADKAKKEAAKSEAKAAA